MGFGVVKWSRCEEHGHEVILFAAGRLLAAIPILFGVSVIVFLLISFIPGDAASAMLGPTASPNEVAALRSALGLDQPPYVQFFLWVSRVVQGDFGKSIQTGRPVLDMLVVAFGNTAILTFAALLVSTVFGLLIGVVSATRRGSILDRGTMLIALFLNSMPVYWFGLILIFIFALTLRVLPTSGMVSTRGARGDPLDVLAHLILPAIAVASFSIATIARTTRASLLEVLQLEYIRTARAKGLSESWVVYRHALRNALLPVTTVIGLQAGYLLGGAVLTETVFAWPGLGLVLYTAIGTRDIPVIQGGILLASFVFVIVNLLIDLLYGFLDPRIRHG